MKTRSSPPFTFFSRLLTQAALGIGGTFFLPLSLAAQQPPTTGSGQGPTPLPPTTVEGQRPGAASPSLSPAPFDPTLPPAPPGQGEGTLGARGDFASPPIQGYKADSSTTGTILNIPTLDFPGSVGTISQDLIRDQNALRLDDVLRNVSGVTRANDFRRPESLFIRGFEVTNRDIRKNGFLDPTPAPRDLANIERVEILKGPASVLYGGGQPSGVVNFITKKPVPDSFLDATYTCGDFDLRRTTVDLNSPLFSDDLLFRLNVAYEDQQSFRDFGFNERFFIAPALTWRIDCNTDFTVEFEHLKDRRRFDSGLPTVNGRLGLLPIERFVGEPDDFQRFQDYHFTAFLHHKIDKDWSFRIGANVMWHDSPSRGTVPLVVASDFGIPLPTLLFRQRQEILTFEEQYYSTIADLAGKFDLLGMEHRLVVGTELGWFRSTFQAGFSDLVTPTRFGLFPTSPIDAAAPFYGLPQPSSTGSFDSQFNQDRYGFYAQDIVTLLPHLKLMTGLRFDIVRTDFDREFVPTFLSPGFPRTVTEDTITNVTPRIGLVYQPIEEVLSLYASYSESFNPPPGGAYRNAGAPQAETGRCYEAGVKADLLEKALSVTLSGFQIDRENVTVQDNLLFLTQVGAQQSRGLEASVVGNLTKYWSVNANYTYLDTEITEDANPLLVGKPFRGIPNNSGSIWTRYNFVQADLDTIGVALGWVYLGERGGDLADTFRLPSFNRWDAGFFYRRDRFNFSLYLENLFDKEYYSSSIDRFSVFPGLPFNIRGTIGMTF